MTAEDFKKDIDKSLRAFASGNFTVNALKFFKTLGYVTERQSPLHKPTFKEFSDTYINGKKFDEVKAKAKEWKYVDLLFQLSKEEVLKQTSLFDTKKVDSTVIETYLFFAIQLEKEQYSRTELSLITREVNRLFPMPAMILFRHGNTLTLSIINRRLHKKDESKDVLEKVTQIKDINIASPHRAHIEILFDLSFDELKEKHQFTNFVELHNAWQRTLDTKELNKKFFNELANWYFWATQKVVFPDDAEKDKDLRNATGVIRLITRLMFVWFLKEKNLVPDDLFDEKKLKPLLKYSDKNKSTYYKAILQNLFFATLNTEMGVRRFRIKSKDEKQRDGHHFIHNVFRYEDEFIKPKETLEKYFANIPFLNGGLFECLDAEIEKPNNKKEKIRIDGFSDRDDNVLKVPDEIFFSEKEKIIDLSEIYGTPKKSKEKVRGLIDILSSYKFTIAENTPIEEEVALDPELLGNVFENLLANYNPETQTTARKQTGSFYTPREIVNYMVDESLIAYLKQKLNANENTEIKIRDLLSYSQKEIQFSIAEKENLITAIDMIKILDPACGSGAFPMGILHKLVHTLHKLDPKNELWKQRQIDKASSIDDAPSREAATETIEEAFENNELDYGRKLYLIENCIYGVDIQPIAVQISKLRFFISLIVEQKTNPKKDNLGVRPLPNLETKFVAANTLMELEKENVNLFTNPEIEKKKEQLKKVRHDYFEARTPKRKENCRNKDKQLRDELAELLVTNHDLQPATAKKVASWNPYDQNASASFFDMEWMFGLKDGFDVVIGNPPYVEARKLEQIDVDYYRNTYTTAGNRVNTFAFFSEKGINLLSNGSVLTYIIHRNSIRSNDYSKLRKFILDNTSILNILSFKIGVFENVTGEMTVLILKKTKARENHAIKIAFCEDTIQEDEISYKTIHQETFEHLPDYRFNIYLTNTVIKLLEKVKQNCKLLEQVSSITQGIIVGDENNLVTKGKLKNNYRPILRGKNIAKYKLEFRNEFVNYHAGTKVLTRGKTPDLFEVPEKILTQHVSSKIIATLDTNQYYYLQTINGIISINKKFPNKYLLALLNSTVLNFFYEFTYNMGAEFTTAVAIENLSKLPIKDANSTMSFCVVVDYLLVQNSNTATINYFQRLIDAMVYELYFPEEIKAGGCEVLKYLANLPELKEGEEENNLKTIEKVYKELSYPKHPITKAIDRMDAVEEIKIIEGKQ